MKYILFFLFILSCSPSRRQRVDDWMSNYNSGLFTGHYIPPSDERIERILKNIMSENDRRRWRNKRKLTRIL